MPTTRPRSAAQTRAAILTAARAQFARDGVDRVTIRAVAAEVGVDPALVMRYFGNKAGLFAESARLDLDLPDLTGLAPAAAAGALVGRFLQVWRADGTFLALLRAAAASPDAARAMVEVFTDQVAPALAVAAVDRPEERAALVGAQLLGFAFARDVLGLGPLVALEPDDVVAWLGPVLERYLQEPMTSAGTGGVTAARAPRRRRSPPPR